MRLFAPIFAAVLLAASPSAHAQEPPKAVPKLPSPPNPGSMVVVSAQAVTDKGKVSLLVAVNKPVSAQEQYTYTVQEPVEVVEDDGKGGKVKKTVRKPVQKQGTRIITKYVTEMKQYPVTGNENLTVTDASGKKLSDDEVQKALEKPAFIFEFTDKPNADLLKMLKPETVVMAWKPQQSPAAPPATPGVVPSTTPPAKPKGEFEPSAAEQEVIDLTNAERKKAGLAALTVSPKLIKAARSHSANMANQGKLDHTLDAKTADQRVTDAGYQWANSGENIAKGQRTPEEAHVVDEFAGTPR